MLKMISPHRAERILGRYADWLEELSARYDIPSALLRAVLYKEMTEIDLLDFAADLIVSAGCFHKKDSSTGYGQVFGATGVKALDFAVDRGLTSYQAFGLPEGRRLDPENISDVRTVWKLMHRDPKVNMELCALTLLCAAEEMTGRIDFSGYTEDELKLILTRYNADVRHITPYGEAVYTLYQSFSKGLEMEI